MVKQAIISNRQYQTMRWQAELMAGQLKLMQDSMKFTEDTFKHANRARIIVRNMRIVGGLSAGPNLAARFYRVNLGDTEAYEVIAQGMIGGKDNPGHRPGYILELRSCASDKEL